jgi:predicted unusual protein kinase regulating ubiquinone biosynthesis (AarF/ABC1/UbiB family)
MPRRRQLPDFDAAHVVLPMARKVVFKPGIIRPLLRLLVWLRVCIQFFGGNAVERLLGRSTIQRRAQRLRRVFEDAGASFAKLGQQLSLRADILPYAYCAELSKMLDRSRAIPTDQAIAVIERSFGRPLGEIFESFDPQPIGSASLASVFQARLRTGERVAVKVRRPGIGALLSADLRALEWLLIVAETLTIIRPGQTRSFRHDLRRMLMGELNFRAEARYTEMFRLRSIKNGGETTAPRVYFKYCTDEVMVSELVSGVWMWELMAAVDGNDQDFLAELRTQGIDPKSLSSTLVRIVHRELLEELFFHADPHPANLVVLPNNRICFIDFGAIGRFSTETRNAWRELHHHMGEQDIKGMVGTSMHLVEPLPPIDVDGIMKAVEENYTDWIYAAESTDAEWWERSTAQTWLRFFGIARQYGIPMSMGIIQFFRATLLYDTIATRLNPDINFETEYRAYAREAGKRARKRVQKYMQKRVWGPTKKDYLVIEQLGGSIMSFFFKWQRLVSDPAIQFKNIVGKIAYLISVFMKVGTAVVIAVGLGLMVDFLATRWFGLRLSWPAIFEALASAWWVQLAVFIVALVVTRRVLVRMSEPDQRPDAPAR